MGEHPRAKSNLGLIGFIDCIHLFSVGEKIRDPVRRLCKYPPFPVQQLNGKEEKILP